jgi:hypothetical protein
MKDSEFLELLNLYLDHEITPADAARLEAEVARDPERLKVYRQYCRMQKACVELAQQHRDSAPAEEALTAAFAPRPAWSAASIWTTGILAAAASLAVVLAYRRPATAPTAPIVAQAAPAVSVAPAPDQFQPVLVATSLALDKAGPDKLFPADDRNGQFAWISQVQLTPIRLTPSDQLFADPKPYELARPAPSDPAVLPEQIDQTAFQFRKGQ